MKKIILAILFGLFSPIAALFRVTVSFAKSFFDFFLKIPAEAIASLVERLFCKVKNINIKLDSNRQKAYERREVKKLTHSLEKMIGTDNILGNDPLRKRFKVISILILELVSFVTTMHGLTQLFAGIGKFVPIMLAVVIQISLTFFCANVSRSSAPKAYRYLLAIVLLISVCFSYFGACVSITPYKDYAKDKYTEVSATLNAAVSHLEEHSSNSESPVSILESAYVDINNVLTIADSRYGEDALTAAGNQLVEYKLRTKTIVTENPKYVVYDWYGNAYSTGGGSNTVEVPDPDALVMISEEENRIKEIKEIQASAETIREMISGVCDESQLMEAVEEQLRTDNRLTDRFIRAAASFNSLCDMTGELAYKMNISFDSDVDLKNLVFRHRENERIKALAVLPEFSEIYAEWAMISDYSEDERENISDRLFNLRDYSTLKQSLDTEVFEAYQKIIGICRDIGYPTEEIESAYQLYDLVIPMRYDLSLLNPLNPSFGTALIALVIAIFNDGLAVLFGVFIDRKAVNWSDKKKAKKADDNFHVYIYTQFKAVVSPMLIDVPVDSNDPEVYYRWFTGLMVEFMDRFDISEKLNQTGYTRYYVGELINKKYIRLVSFFRDCGLMELISSEIAVEIGLISSTDDIGSKAHCILLSKFGERWITDVIGGASDEIIKLFTDA